MVWLGDCYGAEGDQTVTINGTGPDVTNYAVVMDFWLATAVESNQICIGDPSVESMTALVCDAQGSVDNVGVCLGDD